MGRSMGERAVAAMIRAVGFFAIALLAIWLLAGCAAIARAHCEDIYCGNYEDVSLCPHENDVVIICTEDRVAYYNTVAGWFGAAFDAVVGLAVKVM